MLEPVENAQATIDELMGDAARTLIEQWLMSSVEQVVSPKRQGRAGGMIGRHGTERGRIELAERGLTVKRPRLRAKGEGVQEMGIPACECPRHSKALRQRVRQILLAAVSMRRYQDVLPRAVAGGRARPQAVAQTCVACTLALVLYDSTIIPDAPNLIKPRQIAVDNPPLLDAAASGDCK